jgi:transposase
MTKYREILRLKSLGFSERNIALSCNVSRKTVAKVSSRAQELNISWPLEENQTDAVLEETMFPKTIPDYNYIRKELLKNGVSKKLLWTEYCEECQLNNEDPLMYLQFCYYILQDEQRRRATMHIPRKPGEQVEVDWASDPAHIIDPDTGEITDVRLFVGVMTYSQFAYVEAFINEQQRAWISAHVHMYEYFGGVAKILVPDNCTTAVNHRKSTWYTQELNTTYHEMAEHYGTAIIPARVRKPKDKPNAEGSVGNISTWITATLRNEQFFSLEELNKEIRKKLEKYNSNLFKRKKVADSVCFLGKNCHC